MASPTMVQQCPNQTLQTNKQNTQCPGLVTSFADVCHCGFIDPQILQAIASAVGYPPDLDKVPVAEDSMYLSHRT